MSLSTKLQHYLIPPSNIPDDIDVARLIFGEEFLSESSFKSYLQAIAKENFQPIQQTIDTTDILKVLLCHCLKTIQVGIEEAAGYVLLGILLGFFADCLTKILVEPYNFHNQHLVASNSNPGQNLTTDAAIVSIIQPRIGGRYWKTKVIYEYKTAIHPDITRVEVKYIMELMLQAYYVKNYENISTVIACLTDMKTWHYFKLSRNNDNGSMIISFQRDIEFNLPLVPQSQVNDAQLNE